MMAGDDHPADRPDWTCKACGRPWPCPPAREQLASEMQGTDLVLTMSTTMVIAARENPAIPPPELFERFIGWARRLS